MSLSEELGTNLTRPSSDEVEVSVFGRGMGECIAIHYGDNNWAVIDSLRTRRDNPVVLEYFDLIDVDPRDSVKQIIASHWHDDHVAGISDIYRISSQSRLTLAAVLAGDEMSGLISEADEYKGKQFTSGVRELRSIRDIQAEGSRQPFIFAKSHQIILRLSAETNKHRNPVLFEALSPSDKDFSAFLNNIGQFIGSDLKMRRIMPLDRNDIAVAV